MIIKRKKNQLFININGPEFFSYFIQCFLTFLLWRHQKIATRVQS